MMTNIKRAFILLFTISSILKAGAQNIIYEKEDSIFIEEIAGRHPLDNFQSKGDRILALAKEFIGKDYVAGTLDKYENEPLFISCSELDCTTFVELILATAICKESKFTEVCRTLEQIRYRNGLRNDYASRLHYISWWIDDSAKQDIIKEVHSLHHTAEQDLKLDFMSSHPDYYLQLRDNLQLRESIGKHERDFGCKKVKYIPEQLVHKLEKGDVADGDIIAIVTSTEGLDISHVGIAFWIGKQLHMIHASNNKKKVICDPTELHEYLSKSSSSIGIRIFRAL